MTGRSGGVAGDAVEIEGYSGLTVIGRGASSIVFRAHEVEFARNVAIKVLTDGFAGADERRAFERECRAIGSLDHPDIVRVYRAVYTRDGRPGIAMELYAGNLREELDERRGPLGVADVLEIGVRMAVALHVAHSRSILHRDVKPHNIFRSVWGEPALGDFGIARAEHEMTARAAGAMSPAYAAPEVLADQAATVHTDVYALGATLYHLVAGRPPFSARDLRALVAAVLRDDPPPTGRTDVPVGLERVLRAALAKDPRERPESALELARLLTEVQARAGLPVTSIRLDPGVRDAVAPPPPSSGPVLAAPEAHRSTPVLLPPGEPSVPRTSSVLPVPTTASSELEGTIARARATGEPSAPDVGAGPGPRRGRVWISAGVGVAALTALVVGAVVAGGGGDEEAGPPTSTTVPAVVTTGDDFYDVVAAPTGVTVTETADGSWSVDAEVGPGATAVRVETVGGGPVRDVDVASLPLVIEAGDGAPVCVVVYALGDGGRISRPTDPVCSTPD